MAGKSFKDRQLEQAIEAGRQGDRAKAREILLKLLSSDNREPLYWLLMSTVVESRDERIYCLQNAMFLDPDNGAAKHDLELLGAEIPKVNVPAFLPEESEDWQTKEIAAPKVRKRRRKQTETTWSLNWILASLGIGLVIILLGYYLAANDMILAFLQSFSNDEPVAQVSGTLVVTRRATGTPTSASGQASPTNQVIIVPNDPSAGLEATYTPTPVYVNTPHPENAAYQQGLDALAAQDWPAAVTAFESVLAANPQAVDVQVYLGSAYLGAGSLDEASAAFSQAISAQASYAPAYLGRARLQLAQGAGDAIADLNTAILLDDQYVDAYLQRVAFNIDRQDYAAAQSDLDRAQSLAPDSALIYATQAQLALAQEQYSNALTDSQQALALDVTLLPAYLIQAQAQIGLQQYEQAVGSAQRYLTYSGEDGAGWETLGLAFEMSGQHSNAMDTFIHALSLDANLPTAAYYRGLSELDDGSVDAALSDMAVAAAGRPAWFEAHIGLARAQLAAGNPSEAFLQINSNSGLAENDTQRAMVFYWRATTLEALGNQTQAQADWRSLLNLPASAMPDEWRQQAESRTAAS